MVNTLTPSDMADTKDDTDSIMTDGDQASDDNNGSEPACCSQTDDDADDVFALHNELERQRLKHEHKKSKPKSSEKHHHTRHHSHRSHGHHGSEHRSRGSVNSTEQDVPTKTDIIRASARRAERERRKKASEENDCDDKKPKRQPTSRVTDSSSHRSDPKRSSGRQKQSGSETRRTSPSPRTSQRRSGSMSPRRTSPRQSLSASPKHQSGAGSKVSLLSKPGTSNNNSPARSYSDALPMGPTASLIPRPSGTHGYSKPAMEVAVASAVFTIGAVTLIVAFVMGSKAWMIVGAISMGIGGVFIFFGICFYISRHKPIMSTQEHLEARLIDSKTLEARLIDPKQLAELCSEGFHIRQAQTTETGSEVIHSRQPQGTEL